MTTPAERHVVWDRIEQLKRMGLLSFVPHIIDNDGDPGEPLYVCGIGETGEAPVEQEIGNAANAAARAMALLTKVEDAENKGIYIFDSLGL